MISVKRIQGGTDNCYLVTDGKQAVLVDTASGKSQNSVIAECDKYEMKLIILTHVHFDHAENAAALAKKYNVPVALHKKDVELFDSFDHQPLKPVGLVGRVVLGLSKKPLRKTTVAKPENMIFVNDGDDLSSYGIPARIIETPGHTLGSISVDVEGKHLLVGDALDNWIRPGVAHLYYDKEATKKSAEILRTLGERTVYYGHGKPTSNGKY